MRTHVRNWVFVGIYYKIFISRSLSWGTPSTHTYTQWSRNTVFARLQKQDQDLDKQKENLNSY